MIEWLRLEDGSRTLDLSAAMDVERFAIGLPTARAVTVARPQHDGELDYTSRHGAALIEVRGRVWPGSEGSVPDLVDALRFFAHPGRRPRLVWRKVGQAARRATVRFEGGETPLEAESYATSQAQMLFRVPDGKSYSDQLHVRAANAAGDVPGREYDLSFDRSYPFSGGLGLVECVNAGTTVTDPVLRMFGPCESPRVEHVASGRRLTLEGFAVSDGDYVELDVSARTARLNGLASQNLYDALTEARWFSLEPGENQLRFFPETASAGSQLQARWRDAFI